MPRNNGILRTFAAKFAPHQQQLRHHNFGCCKPNLFVKFAERARALRLANSSECEMWPKRAVLFRKTLLSALVFEPRLQACKVPGRIFDADPQDARLSLPGKGAGSRNANLEG